MLDLNFNYLQTTPILGNFFFAIPVFITMVVARYATLAKLIRDTRSEVESGTLKFKDASDYRFHIRHYLMRLGLLRTVLVLSLISGLFLCGAFFLVVLTAGSAAVWFFVVSVVLISLGMILLITELSVSFEALTSHIDFMGAFAEDFDQRRESVTEEDQRTEQKFTAELKNTA